MKIFSKILLILTLLLLSPTSAKAATYYVDSSSGSDLNSCTAAQNQSTPKKSVNSVNTCVQQGGDIVKFKGSFTQTIFPPKNGTVLYDIANISKVEGSTVVFNQPITGLNPETDWVTIYNSRKGNSGAFAVLSVSGNTVTVSTQYLPGGKFLIETSMDPHFENGPLQAAILRPIHYTAWDRNYPPVFNTEYQVYKAINNRVIMVSYLKSISGNGYVVWPAFEVDGNNNGNSDFQIFDHLEIVNATSAISTEANEYQSNYDIVQYNNVHDVGIAGDSIMDELIYWGHWGRPDLHHDFVQIMYNKVGPHKPGSLGDAIDTKQSVHNPTYFGNEIVGIGGTCGDAPIKTEATNVFIANNYIHDIHPPSLQGCGISVADGVYGIWTRTHVIIANNIISNVSGTGISLVDVGGAEIYNNTIYNTLPSADSTTDTEHNAGIDVWAWQSRPTGNIIKNNIIHTCNKNGITSYWGSATSGITSDNNIVYNCTGTAYRYINQGINDKIIDPILIDPESGNFSISLNSPAINLGTDLSAVFKIDKHNATSPIWPVTISPIHRNTAWDIGAYEYSDNNPFPSQTPTSISGDADGNGIVNEDDYIIWLCHYLHSGGCGYNADFNNDNIVDGVDYTIWIKNLI